MKGRGRKKEGKKKGSSLYSDHYYRGIWCVYTRHNLVQGEYISEAARTVDRDIGGPPYARDGQWEVFPALVMCVGMLLYLG